MAKRSGSRAGKKRREKVSPSTQLRLWVSAAGFCEFAGCHAYVLRDDLTLSETNLSNVAHIDPKDRKPTRVGFKTLDDGRKVRFAKRSGELIDA